MTATNARNHFGIFKTKRAKLLAIKYSLELYDKNAYLQSYDFVSFSDVKFIVDNLWLDHFLYHLNKPIDVSYDDYNNIYYNLKLSYSYLLNSSSA